MALLSPTSLDQALVALTDHPDARPLAGGTDLMVAVNAGRQRLNIVIALDRIEELRRWTRDGDDVVLGAGITFTTLLHPTLAILLPALAAAARAIGSPQIRNAGTIGGNLATASPAGDSLPVLVALGASVTVRSASGERTLPIGEFLTGPKHTALAAGELIVSVRVPVARGPQEFLKVGPRNAMVISVAGLAAVADLDARSIRVALGSVGPTVLRAPAAESFAEAHIDWATATLPDHRTAAEFGRLAAVAARPIDDHRSTAAYRTHAIGVLAARALRRMFDTPVTAGSP